VREDGILRDPITQGGLKCVDFVDALAAERSTTEEILVDVGDGHRIRRQAALGGVDRLESRRVIGRRQAWGDSRLQHREAAADPSRSRIDHRSIQRVGDLADQFLRGIARQPGIGVECDHVAEPAGGASLDGDVAGVSRAAQIGVELHQLAPLALPTHPGAFARVPASFAVEEQEPITILLVECPELLPGTIEQDRIIRGGPGGGIGPVGNRSEVDLTVIVRQEVHLQGVHQVVDTVGRSHHGWYDNESAQRVRHSVTQFEPRARSGRQYPRECVVQQRQHQFARRSAGQDRQHDHHDDRQTARQGSHRPQQQADNEGGHEQQATDVARQAHGLDQPHPTFSQSRPITEVGFESGQPIVDQPEPDLTTHLIG